jgi:hypothetical protein
MEYLESLGAARVCPFQNRDSISNQNLLANKPRLTIDLSQANLFPR